jgi:hypothetical protein
MEGFMNRDEFTITGSHKLTAVDLLDQYMIWRLKDNINDTEAYGELEDVRLACKILLRFMGESIE